MSIFHTSDRKQLHNYLYYMKEYDPLKLIGFWNDYIRFQNPLLLVAVEDRDIDLLVGDMGASYLFERSDSDAIKGNFQCLVRPDRDDVYGLTAEQGTFYVLIHENDLLDAVFDGFFDADKDFVDGVNRFLVNFPNLANKDLPEKKEPDKDLERYLIDDPGDPLKE